MRYPTITDDLRRGRLIVASVAIALLLVTFATYAVMVNRTHSPVIGPARPWQGSVQPSPAADASVVATLPTLRPTSDPETFARDVGEALFAWDTATLVGRADHIEQLIKLGDPTGESTSGLLADIGTYLPTPQAWVELAKYATRQWISVDSVSVPNKWAEAQAQAGAALVAGTTAYTILGTRHRSGVWEGAPVSTEHGVSFTIFMVCGPTYPECHLLRLSELDNPLD